MFQEFFANPGPTLALVIAIVISFNLFLSGLKSALEYIADKTVTDVDNKALAIVNKVIEVLAKVLDLIGYNKK